MKFHLFVFTNAQRVCYMCHNHSVSHINFLEYDTFFLLPLTHWCWLLVKLLEAALTSILEWEAQKEFWLCQDYLLILLMLSTSGCYLWAGVGEYSSYYYLISRYLGAVKEALLVVLRPGFCLKSLSFHKSQKCIYNIVPEDNYLK